MSRKDENEVLQNVFLFITLLSLKVIYQITVIHKPEGVEKKMKNERKNLHLETHNRVQTQLAKH